MRSLRWILPVLLFFRVEIFNFLVNLETMQWILFLCIAFSCLLLAKRRIKYLIIRFARYVKYFSLEKCRKILSRWVEKNNAEAVGKSLFSWLERSAFTKFGCIVISAAVFSHYPILLRSSTAIAIFLLTQIAYSLISLTFRRGMLISVIGMYLLMAVMPYATAFISYKTGINLFKVLPPEIIYFLNLNVSSLTQTATKLFLFTAPCFALIILFLILLSAVLRLFSAVLKFFANLFFAISLKALQSPNLQLPNLD